MTPEKFNQRHGRRWEDFKKDPMFADLLRVMDGHESPAVQVHKLSLQNITDHSPALLGSISGFALARALLLKLGVNPTPQDDEPDFSMTIEEQFQGDSLPDLSHK